MMRFAMACTLPVLVACGDPFAGIERVSEGAVLPQRSASAALPSEEELARERSILGDLLSEREPTLPEGTAGEAQALDSSADAAVAEANVGSAGRTTGAAPAPEGAVADDQTQIVVRQAEPISPTRGGVLGWLHRAAQNKMAVSSGEAEITPVVPSPSDTDLPPAKPNAETTQVASVPDLVEPQKRRGLLGTERMQARNGPDKMDVVPGTILPFGTVARVCEANPARTSKIVDKAARKGRGYALFDTQPDSTQPRTFYVTGFSDNCPRQFTASLALFGDPAFHEQLRYGLPAKDYPYSTTDTAYEKLKRQVCNVGRNTPCGDRIDRLSRNTTFISAYENYTDNARWADMLVHDGTLLATALKTP